MKGVKEVLIVSFLLVCNLLLAQKYPSPYQIMHGKTVIASDTTQSSIVFKSLHLKKYKVKELPIFCRMEDMIFKKSKMNLKINLGSNEYVRRLEGK